MSKAILPTLSHLLELGIFFAAGAILILGMLTIR